VKVQLRDINYLCYTFRYPNFVLMTTVTWHKFW